MYIFIKYTYTSVSVRWQKYLYLLLIFIYIYICKYKEILYAYVDTVVPKSRKVISKGLKIKRPTKYTKPKTSKQNINYMNPDAVKPQIASSLVN